MNLGIYSHISIRFRQAKILNESFKSESNSQYLHKLLTHFLFSESRAARMSTVCPTALALEHSLRQCANVDIHSVEENTDDELWQGKCMCTIIYAHK